MTDILPLEIVERTGPVALFGYARAKPGKEAQLRDTLTSFLAPTRAEAGVVAYFLHEEPDQPGVLSFYEHWESGTALADHLQVPAMAEFAATRHELLDGDLEITFLTPTSTT